MIFNLQTMMFKNIRLLNNIMIIIITSVSTHTIQRYRCCKKNTVVFRFTYQIN